MTASTAQHIYEDLEEALLEGNKDKSRQYLKELLADDKEGKE